MLTAVAFALVSLASDSAFAARQSRFRNGSEVRAGKTHSKASARHQTTSVRRRDGNLVREEGKMVLYKKRNVVDFDDALIEGEVKNPSEFYFVHRPEEKFGSLVKKRRNFHKEMLRDTVMIR